MAGMESISQPAFQAFIIDPAVGNSTKQALAPLDLSAIVSLAMQINVLFTQVAVQEGVPGLDRQVTQQHKMELESVRHQFQTFGFSLAGHGIAEKVEATPTKSVSSDRQMHGAISMADIEAKVEKMSEKEQQALFAWVEQTTTVLEGIQLSLEAAGSVSLSDEISKQVESENLVLSKEQEKELASAEKQLDVAKEKFNPQSLDPKNPEDLQKLAQAAVFKSLVEGRILAQGDLVREAQREVVDEQKAADEEADFIRDNLQLMNRDNQAYDAVFTVVMAEEIVNKVLTQDRRDDNKERIIEDSEKMSDYLVNRFVFLGKITDAYLGVEAERGQYNKTNASF